MNAIKFKRTPQDIKFQNITIPVQTCRFVLITSGVCECFYRNHRMKNPTGCQDYNRTNQLFSNKRLNRLFSSQHSARLIRSDHVTAQLAGITSQSCGRQHCNLRADSILSALVVIRPATWFPAQQHIAIISAQLSNFFFFVCEWWLRWLQLHTDECC